MKSKYISFYVDQESILKLHTYTKLGQFLLSVFEFEQQEYKSLEITHSSFMQRVLQKITTRLWKLKTEILFSFIKKDFDEGEMIERIEQYEKLVELKGSLEFLFELLERYEKFYIQYVTDR